MKKFFMRFLRVPLSIASFAIMLAIMLAGMLSSCASYVPPPPTPAYYAYYPGACPTFGPVRSSATQESSRRTESPTAVSPPARPPLTVPGGSNADCVVPESLFGSPPITGPPYRSYGSRLYGPVIYRP